MTMEALPQDLADSLVTRNFDPEYFDDQGQPTEAGDAKTIKFDYVASSGKNYGTAVVVIADDELSLFYGDNLGRGMEPEDKEDWFSFLEQLSNTAASHSATWSPRDINQLKHTLAGIAAIKEGLFEGYYGNRRVSYMGEQTQARLVINHNRVLGEDDKRFRYVESLFIETADQERFRLPFKSLAGGRAMLEHVRSGGRPYDVRGNHITEIVGEMAVLSRFNRAQHKRVYEGVTQELVESARQYYHNLQETVRHLGSPRGYQAYFESWAPDQTGEAEALVENLRDLFVEQTLDARIEAALPTLAKIQQQGNNMKEAQIFENWVNALGESHWALPETPEQLEKLNQLMSAELIVGPDATNAKELLGDIVGDDELFNILNDLADNNPRANIWDDSGVQRRLAELGIQTPQSTQAEPANVKQDTAPAAPPVAEGSDGYEPIADAIEQYITNHYNGEHGLDTDDFMKVASMVRNGSISSARKFASTLDTDPRDKLLSMLAHGMAEGDNMATFEQDRELAEMLKYAGVPVSEGVLKDDTGNTFDHLLDRFGHEVENFKQTGNLDDDLYDALFDYYSQHGAMPYRVRNAKDDTANRWVAKHLSDDLGLDEGWKGALAGGLAGAGLGSVVPGLGTVAGGIAGAYAGHKIGDQGISDPSPAAAKPGVAAPQRNAPIKITAADRLAMPSGPRKASFQKPIAESSCNMTMEGSYCPEHGLAECGGMYEDGGNSQITSGMKTKYGTVVSVDGNTVTVKASNGELTTMNIHDIQQAMYEDGGAVGMPYSMGEELNEIGDTPAGRAALQRYQDKAGNQVDDHWQQVRDKSHLPTDPKMAKRNAGTVAAGNRTHGFGIDQNQQDKVTGRFNYRDAVGKTHVYQKNNPLEQGMAETAPDSDNRQWSNKDMERLRVATKDFDNIMASDAYGRRINQDATKQRLKTKPIAGPKGVLPEQGMGEGVDDPINSNSAMTGSYYEGKETKTQEGDALLARIKSLALLR